MTLVIGRRGLIAALGVAAAWSLAALAQQPERMRRIGVLMLYPENDPEGQRRATAFREGLQKLGWVVGRNVQIDFQWGLGDVDWIRSAAAQLLRLAPDVILANGTPAAKTMQQASRTVPVIFIAGSDPVLDGLVPSLAHPGGNLTGVYVFEPSFGAKLLQLYPELRENPKTPLAKRRDSDSTERMIRPDRIAAKPDRVGSGRVGRSSSGPTCECAGVARRWDELRGDCEGPVAGRRHHPHLVSPV